MIREELIPEFMKHQEKIYLETLNKYAHLDGVVKNSLEKFCKSAFETKISYIDFEQESQKFCADNYIKLYILAQICVSKVLSTRTSLINMFKWFRNYDHTELGLFYNYIIKEELKEPSKQERYLKKLEGIADYANKTTLDSLRKDERAVFEKKLEESAGVSDILEIFNSKNRGFYNYYSNGILYFALIPILNINLKKVVQILSEINNIYQVEEFLFTNQIQNDLEIICNMLKYIPEITNKNGEWNSKKFLLPLLVSIFYNYLFKMSNILSSKNSNIKELSQDIIIFLNSLQKRKDFEFIIRKWLLYLGGQIDSGNKSKQDVTSLILQIIGEKIVSTDTQFGINFFKKESAKGYDRELLTALVYTAESTVFPQEYNQLFEEYILNLKNKINIFPDKSYLKNEHYVLGQLFVSIDNPLSAWRILWNKLYKERRFAMLVPYSESRHDISHSQYLILVGIGAIEYFISEKNKTSALLLIQEVWKALMEIYLTGQYFLYQDFIYQIINRLVLLKNLLKGDLGNEINTIKYNPELISKVIINLKHNNGSLDFISADNDILNSLEIYITEWKMSKGKRKSEYADDYYQELEEIFNRYSTNV